jgi:hypothetical protein
MASMSPITMERTSRVENAELPEAGDDNTSVEWVLGIFVLNIARWLRP